MPRDVVTFDLKDVRRALLGIPRHSSAGPSGLKPDFVRQLVVADGHELLGAFAGLFTRMQSEVPTEVAPWLFGAKLVGLWKTNGDLRPIASGELVRRALAKALIHKVVTPRLTLALLSAGQVAVGARNGMEAAIVAVRRAAALAREKLDASFVVVKLDRTNAFNALDRAYMLRAVERRVPAAMAYAVAAYARPSHLLFGDVVVSSQQGGQQGDPLMPLAYALAEAQIMEDAEVPATLLRAAFLDDLTLAGPREAVRTAFDRLRAASVAAHLDFNEAKCVAVSLDEAADRAIFPGWRFEHLADFGLLGSPCGDFASVERFTARALEKAAAKAKRILVLHDDPHLQYLLLRYTAGFAVSGFYARACGPTPAAAVFDRAMQVLMDQIVSVPAEAVQVMALPIRLGGLGLRPSFMFAAVAHAALVVEVSSILQALCPQMLTAEAIKADPTWQQAFVRLSPELKDSTPFEALLSGGAAHRGLQRKWSVPLVEAQFKAVWDRAPEVVRARLYSQQCPLAGAWLYGRAGVSRDLDVMPADLFRCVVRHRLGVPISSQESPCVCGETRDIFGRHQQHCRLDGAKIWPHNAVRDELAAMLQVRCPGGICTEPHPFAAPEDRNLRLDVSMPMALGRRFFDVAIIDPILNEDRIRHAVAERGGACTQYENVKIARYADPFSRLGGDTEFVPLIFDVFGGWGQAASNLLPALLRPAGRLMTDVASLAVPLAMQRLSFVLLAAVGTILNRQS